MARMDTNEDTEFRCISYSCEFVSFVAIFLLFGFRIFLIPSDFWFRISDFQPVPLRGDR
jgi:hypothetical protein